ncbi:MAG: electron transfer flavoprotein subunit alpha [Thermodesulfobacteriota bacterium]
MLIIDKDRCIGCGVCEANCAFGGIEVIDGCAVANDRCTLCGSCADVCEPGAITIERGEEAATDLASWQGIAVYVEWRGGRIAPVSFELLGAGRALADERGVALSAILLGHNVADRGAELIAHGADRVVIADDANLAEFTDDAYGNVLYDILLSEKPEALLAGATAIGRSFIPRVATMLATGLTADCTGLAIDPESGALLQTRPAFGGNIMATILCPRTRPQMATVRPNVMQALVADPGRTGTVVAVHPAADRTASRVRVISSERSVRADEVNLHEADVVIAGGRGLGGAEGFAMVRELAELLGGAVAASRAAVDSGWIGYPHQVGQTGKTVSPRIYITCGISGAIQHAVGMRSSDVIIAINKDENAPIFDIATYGVVGDLFEILPGLIGKLKQRKTER